MNLGARRCIRVLFVARLMSIIHLACTRFNDATWAENQAFRKKSGCVVYGTDSPVSERIYPGEWMMVFEMNNTTNQIMGIGLISTSKSRVPPCAIYSNCCYNVCVYRGTQWFSRAQIDEIDPSIVQDADQVLFLKRSHMKRLSSITVLGEKVFSHWPGQSLKSLRRRVMSLPWRRRVPPVPTKSVSVYGRGEVRGDGRGEEKGGDDGVGYPTRLYPNE